MNQQPSQQPDPDMRRVLAAQNARRAVETMLNYTSLPAPTLIARPELVHIIVADVDDLGQWLTELGGEIHVSPETEGVQMWALHTSTDTRSTGAAELVRVQVTAAVPAGELVMDYIRAAVVPEDQPVPYALTPLAAACLDCGTDPCDVCPDCATCVSRCKCSGAADMARSPLLAAVPAPRGHIDIAWGA